jgi:hypothetical protein
MLIGLNGVVARRLGLLISCFMVSRAVQFGSGEVASGCFLQMLSSLLMVVLQALLLQGWC